MKATLVALVVLGAILCAQAKVVDLTPDNFDQYVDGSKGAFVEFFAPWYDHLASNRNTIPPVAHGEAPQFFFLQVRSLQAS